MWEGAFCKQSNAPKLSYKYTAVGINSNIMFYSLLSYQMWFKAALAGVDLQLSVFVLLSNFLKTLLLGHFLLLVLSVYCTACNFVLFVL